MSFTSLRGTAQSSAGITVASKHTTISPEVVNIWTRNPSWLPLPNVSLTDEKVVMLVHVERGDTPIAFTTTNYNFNVDWGDGTNSSSSIVGGANAAMHNYTFGNALYANTMGNVSINSITNTIERVSHGYAEGARVKFYNSTVPELAPATFYTVTNVTANNFQLVTTSSNLSSVTFGANGTATLLPYQQVIVTITPNTAGQMSGIKAQAGYNWSQYATSLQGSPGFILDLAMGGPNLNLGSGNTILGFGSTTTQTKMEQVRVIRAPTPHTTGISTLLGFSKVANLELNFDGITGTFPLTGLFNDVYCLPAIPNFNTANVTSLSSMGTASTSGGVPRVRSWAPWDLSRCTQMSGTAGFTALTIAPKWKVTANLTLFAPFNNWYSLESIPSYDTRSVSTWQNFATGSSALRTVAKSNTSAGTNFQAMFNFCYALKSVPEMDFRIVTTLQSMFAYCYNLRRIGQANITVTSSSMGNPTGFQNTFQNCYNLVELPGIIAVGSAIPVSLTLTATNAYNLVRQGDHVLSGASFVNQQDPFTESVNYRATRLLGSANLTGGYATLSTTYTGCSGMERFYTDNPSSMSLTSGAFSRCYDMQTMLAPWQTWNVLSITAGGMTGTLSGSTIFRNFRFANVQGTFGPGIVKMSLSDLQSGLNTTKSKAAPAPYYDLTRVSGYSHNRFIGNVTAGSNVIVVNANISAISSNVANTSVVWYPYRTIQPGHFIDSNVHCNIANVVANSGTNTFTYANHGFANGQMVGFYSNGGLANLQGDYASNVQYIVNPTTNTFQIANTAGGTPVTINGNVANITMRFATYIVSANATAVVLSNPANASANSVQIWTCAPNISWPRAMGYNFAK